MGSLLPLNQQPMTVRVEGLTKMYGAQKALDQLSFEVEPGQILGFLGPNGAGKTTTMKIITGFLSPSAGEVHIGDLDPGTQMMEIRKIIGYLPEHNPLYLDMYVKEFLGFIGRIYRLSGKVLDARIREVIEMTGLGVEQHKKIGMLSKGYRQRVGLAQALIHDPKILILDEPTTGLDPNQIVEIRKLIKEVGKDKTVIFSSHILSEVEAISDRVIIINRGKLVADESIEELRARLDAENNLAFRVNKGGFSLENIQKIRGIQRIEKVDEQAFIIITSSELDLREKIFEECVAQSFYLESLSQQSFSLEEVFRLLTSVEEVPQVL
ncbi:MAG: gliding motility-associated ABC transporter ATP-binding subunit GldA [Bacteroidota bacterium]